jgi:uncharacterized protein
VDTYSLFETALAGIRRYLVRSTVNLVDLSGLGRFRAGYLHNSRELPKMRGITDAEDRPMLIEFRVENHRSLRDEQAITMEASGIGEASDPRPRRVAGHEACLLPAVVLYGANASGKSNVLAALAFMREAVVFSHRKWEPEGGIPRTAFAWGGKRKEASMFEVSFLLNETKYEYGFTVDDEMVQEEWLFAWPSHRKQVWFEREGNTYKFGEHLKGPNEAVKEVTRQNALFLSAAAQHGHAALTSLFSWFRRISAENTQRQRYPVSNVWYFPRDVVASEEQGSLPSRTLDEEDTLSSRIQQLLKASDTGIVDVKRIVTEQESRGRMFRRRRTLLQHQLNDEDSWLDLEDESEGTKTLYQMAPALFQTLDSGGLLLVDELESSLHPLLGLAIVRMFNCQQSNPRNAQIMFTTHDTNLLGTTLGEPPLRRDQVWFTEKDSEGASRIYPLTDYKPRKSENLERGYLQGRYGAIPFLGDTGWITE